MPKHITEEQFDKIKYLCRLGLKQYRVADFEGVSRGTVSKIANSENFDEFRGVIKPKAPTNGSGQMLLLPEDQILNMLEDLTGMVHELLERQT